MNELEHFITDKTPHGWNAQPLWSLFRRRKKTGFSSEALLSVYRDYGVIPKSSRDDNYNKESDDLSGYQLVSEGSLVTNKMKAWQGSIAISRYRGIVSPAYYVYQPLSAECDQFLHYLLRSELYISLYGRISKGVRVNQWDLEHAAFRAVPVALPDLPTQKAIADFLDRETARIDQLIEKKQRMVEVLGEKRAAAITRSVCGDHRSECLEGRDQGAAEGGIRVTKYQLPPLLPLKRLAAAPRRDRCRAEDLGSGDCRTAQGSGDVMRLRHLVTIGPRPPIRTELHPDANVTFVPMEAIADGLGGLDISHTRPFIEVASGSYNYFAEGDLLLAKVTPCFENGKKALAQSLSNDIGYATSEVHVIRPGVCRIHPKYLFYLLCSEDFRAAGMASMTGAGGLRRVSDAAVLNYRPSVTDLPTQKAIADFLDGETASIDALITKIRKTIDRLREFRSALITAAVTGQIDVSTWGKQGTTERRLDQIEEATSA